MAVAKIKETIGEEDISCIIADTIFRKTVPKVFQFVFKWGSKKPPNMTVKSYLQRERGMSHLSLKKSFTKSQIRKMEQDPAGHNFDITLLYVCIQYVCKDVSHVTDPLWMEPADTLEYYLYFLKQMRNTLAHGTYEFKSKRVLDAFVNDLRRRIEFVYVQAGARYGIEESIVHECISEAKKEIDHILKLDSIKDLESMTKQMLKMKIDAGNLIKTKGKKELMKYVGRISQVNFSHMMSSARKLVDVSSVFVDLDLMTATANKGKQSSVYTSVQNILETKTETGKMPSVTIIVGDAGMGKTTLMKYIMSEWSTSRDSIRQLNQFDLVLHLECRTQTVTSFEKLLRSLMPQTTWELTDEVLVESSLKMNALLIVDGFDELNPSSSKLFHELLQVIANHGMKMLITTRPQKRDILNGMIPSSVEICQLEIVGVPVEKHSEYIMKVDKVLKNRKQKQRDVAGLLSFISDTPWCSKFIVHPLNLSYLILFWVEAPERIELLRTSTRMYEEILKLKKETLLKRLLLNGKLPQMSDDELENCLSHCLKVIYRQCLEALISGNLVLSEGSMGLLKEMCLQERLPFEEIFSAFFLADETKSQRTFFIHKEFWEFYGAHAILDCLKRADVNEVVQNVSKNLYEILVRNQLPVGATKGIMTDVQKRIRTSLRKKITVLDILTDLHGADTVSLHIAKYQKVLIHLIGLLKLEGGLSQCYATELVELLKKSGMKDSEEWLNVLVETECDSNILGHMKETVSTESINIRDGHLRAAFHLLQHVEFYFVSISLSGDPNKLKDLRDVLKVLKGKNIQLKLSLSFHWRYPEHGTSDNLLNYLSGGDDSK